MTPVTRRHFRATCIVWVTTVIAAVPAVAQTSVWGLQRGDSFNIETTVEQETTLQLDGREETTSKSKEKFSVQYVVFSSLPDETVIQAKVTNLRNLGNSDTAHTDLLLDRQLQQLRRIQLTLSVDPQGVVTQTQGGEQLLRQLAGVSKRSQKLMQNAVSPDAVATWINQPFWLAAPGVPVTADQTWERVGDSSLGLLGSVRAVLTFKVTKADENSAQVSIEANARHIPPTSTDNDTAARLTFSDVTAEIENYSGSGLLMFKVPQSDADADKPGTATLEEPAPGGFSKRRPWFDGLTLEWSIDGSATVRSGSTSRVIKFQHKQRQTSRLQEGYFTGAPRGFTPFGAPR